MNTNRFLLAVSEPKVINTTAGTSVVSTLVSFAEQTLVLVQWAGAFIAAVAGLLAIIGWFYDRFVKKKEPEAKE
jgi:hypothetical protein